MGTTLNKAAYTKLIEEDIAWLEKQYPGRSLEKEHIIDTLKWSISSKYPDEVPDEVQEAQKYIRSCESDMGFMGSPQYYNAKKIVSDYYKI